MLSAGHFTGFLMEASIPKCMQICNRVVLESECREDQFSKMLVRAELVKEYVAFLRAAT